MLYTFGIKDFIDIVMVALLLYGAYRIMKTSGAANIFVGILTFILFWFLIVHVFKLELMSAILNSLVNVGVIALVVIFQNEIRRFFSRLGSRQNWHFLEKIPKIFSGKGDEEKQTSFPVMKLVMACRDMSRSKTGALIVISRKNDLQEYIGSGDTINADINTRLIENIFFKNSPLHDGAMIIVDNRIRAAGAILPVSGNPDIPRHLGLRHRAAMGISERTDAIVIIVSEETGTISIAMNAKYMLNVTPEQLERFLTENIREQ